MKKSISIALSAFLSMNILGLGTGCASGGFKITRKYAKFVNSQHVVIRVILYILTSVVFGVTLLLDTVIFNTIDFWEGKVSAGPYEFQKNGKHYAVNHEILEDSKLKKSTIQITNLDKELLQTVVLKQTKDKTIQVFIDGQLKGQVQNIHEAPLAKVWTPEGKVIKEPIFKSEAAIASLN